MGYSHASSFHTPPSTPTPAVSVFPVNSSGIARVRVEDEKKRCLARESRKKNNKTIVIKR